MHFWYQTKLHPLSILLLPFSWMFRLLIAIRRLCYRTKLFQSYRSVCPVIVVGNITVGGTGKTPMVIYLAELLQRHQFRPGIVSRGVGGKLQKKPRFISENDDVAEVGDEALLLHERTQCPLVVCVDRRKAVQLLLQKTNCNIILTDDGLQHYALQRDIEIVMIDCMRHVGNHQLLPAGPLREPVSRLKQADFVIMHGGQHQKDFNMHLEIENVIQLKTNQSQSIHHIQKTVHAVAGIGNPKRFFTMLEKLGFKIIPHIFKDHHLYSRKDFDFSDDLPILMTEKDAVKCKRFADERYWFLRVAAKIDKSFERKLLEKLHKTETRHDPETDFHQSTCRTYY